MNRKFYNLLFILIFLPISLHALTNQEILESIREYLPELVISKTGAIDAAGNYTKGSGNGLNCSGFAKWIVDGFYTPIAEKEDYIYKYMSLVKLREKHIGERGGAETLEFEYTRDPFFALDWTRNIASELSKARKDFLTSYKGHDVCDFDYSIDKGFLTKDIPDKLKKLAKKFPNRIYLGAINGPYGSPNLWQYYHVVVFIPYLKDGEIEIAVLETDQETSFEYLWKRYPDTYCHLVWIENTGDFKLKSP